MTQALMSRAASLAVAALLSVSVGSAHAGLDQVMRDRFNMMVSGYPAGLVAGDSMTTVSGGRLRVRMAPQNYALWNSRPPHLKAGCNGIDMFGGSFSFISADQIVDMLESIASSAASFFFIIAIRSISDMLGNTMKEIEQLLMSMNQGLLDSCEAGKDIAAGLAGGLGIQSDTIAGVVGTASASDSWDSFRVAGRSPLSDLFQRNPTMARQMTPGNIVYRALRDQMGGAFTGGDQLAIRQLMSFVGTVVVCVPGRDGCPPEDAGAGGTTTDELQTKSYFPLLTLQDLIHGSAVGEGNTQVYRCFDSDCMDPQPEAAQIVGLKTLLDTTMKGAGLGTGLIGKWRDGRTAFTPEEARLNELGQQHITLVKHIAMFNEAKARQVYEELKDLIAIEWAEPLIGEILNFAGGAMSAGTHAGSAQALQIFNDAMDRFNEQRQVELQRATAVQPSIEAHQAWVNERLTRNAVRR